LFYDNDAYVFARRQGSETVIIAINRSDKEKKLTVPAATIGLGAGTELRVLFGGVDKVRVSEGVATVTVPARSAIALGR